MWTLILLLLGCAPRVDGEWVGACETPDVGVRLWVTVQDEAPMTLRAWLVSRPDDTLLGACQSTVDGVTVDVSGCEGAWQLAATPSEPVPFVMRGEVTEAEPGNTLAGTCTWDGATGAVAMLRMASEQLEPVSQ